MDDICKSLFLRGIIGSKQNRPLPEPKKTQFTGACADLQASVCEDCDAIFIMNMLRDTTRIPVNVDYLLVQMAWYVFDVRTYSRPTTAGIRSGGMGWGGVVVPQIRLI